MPIIKIFAVCCTIIGSLILARLFERLSHNPSPFMVLDSPDRNFKAAFRRLDKKIGPFTIDSDYEAMVFKMRGPRKQVGDGIFSYEIPEQDLLPHLKGGQIEGVIQWSEDSRKVDFFVTDLPIHYAIENSG